MRERGPTSEPRFLPDGRRFVYVVAQEAHGVMIFGSPRSIRTKNCAALAAPAYSQTVRRAAYSRSSTGSLWPGPFDLARGVSRTDRFPWRPSGASPQLGYLLIDFSANTQGMLVYPLQTTLVGTPLARQDRQTAGSLGASGDGLAPVCYSKERFGERLRKSA
jgi:hypothetical protein